MAESIKAFFASIIVLICTIVILAWEYVLPAIGFLWLIGFFS